jgi:hypothetical protein
MRWLGLSLNPAPTRSLPGRGKCQRKLKGRKIVAWPPYLPFISLILYYTPQILFLLRLLSNVGQDEFLAKLAAISRHDGWVDAPIVAAGTR